MDDVGVVAVPDDVQALVLLPNVLQHQVAQRVEVPSVQPLAAAHQNHLGRVIGAGLKHNLSNVPGRDIDVDVLPEERRPALGYDWQKQSHETDEA